jgi:hypothetical protein
LPASNRGQINYPGIPLSRKTVKAFQSIKKHDALSNIDRSAIAVTGLLLDDYYASGDGLTKRQIAEVTNYQIQAVTEAFSKLLGMLLDNKEDDQKKFLPKNLMLFRKKSGHQEDTLYKLFREGMEKRNFVRTRSRRHNDTSHD